MLSKQSIKGLPHVLLWISIPFIPILLPIFVLGFIVNEILNTPKAKPRAPVTITPEPEPMTDEEYSEHCRIFDSLITPAELIEPLTKAESEVISRLGSKKL